eukprot:TRINITY_DN2961_c0_g1_i1.p1 TRINITY_DN2961_c0_g1~~TRINITY_DN2961_c0_g1_i1.p1  ORF type:complete len:171 (-),score=55.38 TRINITY_DN2961_c0_g1_i1:33-545(-)
MERVNRLTTQVLASGVPKQKQEYRLQLRELEAGDYHKGFLQLLGQLTTVGDDITFSQFSNRLREQQLAGHGVYRVVVIEDLDKKLIIATATLFVEKKFVHSCGLVGHVEDVVVNSTYRGQNLGLRVVQQLKDWAKEAGCYKIILDCSDKNIAFYNKLGFEKKEAHMAFYY